MKRDIFQGVLIGFVSIAVIGLIYLGLTAPQKLELIMYKIILISTALSLIYFADVAFFPNQKPNELIKLIDGKGDDEITDPAERANVYHLLAAVNIRRAIILAGFLVAFCTGL